MDDNEMLTLVRESFSGVRAGTPLNETVRRGGALRGRRRARVVTGAAAIAGAGLAAVAVLTSGQSPSPSEARLAAWTVTTEANGTVDVTIRELTDAAGLQRTLRAHGIPARVVFDTIENGHSGNPELLPGPAIMGAGTDGVAAAGGAPGARMAVPPLPPGCQRAESVPVGANVLTKIVGLPKERAKGVAVVLHPAGIPSGTALYLAVNSRSTQHNWDWTMYLVKASPSCTGT